MAAPLSCIQSLWLKRDLLTVIVRFLDLSQLSELPILSRSFASAHWSVLNAVARSSGTLRACNDALLCALQDAGHESSRIVETWDGERGPRHEWFETPCCFTRCFSRKQREELDANCIEVEGEGRLPGQGLRLRLERSDRNCVRRLRARLRFGTVSRLESVERVTDLSAPSDGGISLETAHRVEIATIRLGIGGIDEGPVLDGTGRSADREVSLDWAYRDEEGFFGRPSRVIKLVRNCDADRWYDIDVSFDWRRQCAVVSVDGAVVAPNAPFMRWPLRYIFLTNHTMTDVSPLPPDMAVIAGRVRVLMEETFGVRAGEPGSNFFGPFEVEYFRASRHFRFANLHPLGFSSDYDADADAAEEEATETGSLAGSTTASEFYAGEGNEPGGGSLSGLVRELMTGPYGGTLLN